jgi:hypothetical protein
VEREADAVEADLELGATTLQLIGALGPVVMPDPLAAGTIIVGTLGAAGLLQGVLGRRQRRRLAIMDAAIRDIAGAAIPELVERIRRVEHAAGLAHLAIAASANAQLDEQAAANGRLLVHGVLEEREEDADFVIRTLSRLGETELRALVLLFKARREQASTWPTPGELLTPTVPTDLVEPVMASLAGAGLVLLDPPDFPGFTLTALGARLGSELSDEARREN